MRMFCRLATSLSMCVATLAMAPLVSPVGAQDGASTTLEGTIGAHVVSGGAIDHRNGLLMDLLAAGRIGGLFQRPLVIAGGVGAVMGGFGDRCLLTSNGGCAGNGNFVVLNVLVGIEQPFGSASARFLVGPAIYDGANARSAGLQGQVDVASPTKGRMALGAMVRATVLPSHNGQALVGWGTGISVAFR